MELNKWSEEIHQLAVEKGWWENNLRPMTELLMLVISEIAEATEEARSRKPDLYYQGEHQIEGKYIVGPSHHEFEKSREWNRKPEGEAVELADAVIRVFDIAGKHQMNLERGTLETIERIGFFDDNPDQSDAMSINPNFYHGLSPLEVHFTFCQTLTQPSDFHELPALFSWFINGVHAYFTHKKWNLEETIRLKHEYNKTRPHRHGGKKY